MGDPSAENARALLAAWPERTGLPGRLLEGLPPVVALFSIEGQPAFGAAVLARMSGSTRGLLKMRDFEVGVDEALRDLGFRLDATASRGRGVDSLAERVELLRGTLSQSQVEQLGVLFEDYLRSTDPEWLVLVLRAAAAVVKDAVAEGTRRSLIARLPHLSVTHLRELARIRDRPERARRLGSRLRDTSPLVHVLLQLGLVRESMPAEAEPVSSGGVRVGDHRGPEPELRPTSLGLAALKLFGPIDPGT